MTDEIAHVVMFSGGVGSWAAAKRVAAQHGLARLTLLFMDTLMEDEDLYRFLVEAAADVGVPLTRIAEGRTPWQVFEDERFLGNSRIDPCSRILKRELADRWLKQHCDPEKTRVHAGIDWSESHRFTRMAARYAARGWTVTAPLCAPPYLLKQEMLQALRRAGITPPRLYSLGFSHNNCGGFCVKAGQGHFARLLKTLPDRYAYHEQKEQDIRTQLGDVAIMVEQEDEDRRPLTMRALRLRTESGQQPDLFDVGGCGCFVDVEEDVVD